MSVKESPFEDVSNHNPLRVRALCPFAGEWLSPDEWYASQLREARQRRGPVFALRNAWARLRDKPTKIHGNDLALGAQILWEDMTKNGTEDGTSVEDHCREAQNVGSKPETPPPVAFL